MCLSHPTLVDLCASFRCALRPCTSMLSVRCHAMQGMACCPSHLSGAQNSGSPPRACAWRNTVRHFWQSKSAMTLKRLCSVKHCFTRFLPIVNTKKRVSTASKRDTSTRSFHKKRWWFYAGEFCPPDMWKNYFQCVPGRYFLPRGTLVILRVWILPLSPTRHPIPWKFCRYVVRRTLR